MTPMDKLFLLWILAHSTVLLQSGILFVPGVLFTMVSNHDLLDDEDKWQGEVIVFSEGKIYANCEIFFD